MDTKTTMLTVLLLAGAGRAQGDLPTSPALEQALQIAELQHDDAAARDALAEILKNQDAPGAVRRRALLEIGRLTRRLGQENAARDMFRRVADGEDAVARRARELLGREPQDAARAKEMRERAAKTLDAYRSGAGSLFRDLLWYGDVAAPLLIERFEDDFAHNRLRQDQASAAGMADVLWKLEGARARAFLDQQTGASDVARRRVVALGIGRGLPRDRLDLVRRCLADPDQDVVIPALNAAPDLDVDDLAPRIADSRVEVRIQALRAMQTWLGQSPARQSIERRDVSAKLTAALATPLAATDPNEFRMAVDILCRVGGHSPEGRANIVRMLPRMGDAPVALADRTEPDENAGAMRRVLEELGPRSPSGGGRAACQVLETYLRPGNWGRDAMDSVLTALRLGYLDLVNGAGDWLARSARDEDAARIAEAIDPTHNSEVAEQWLSKRPLPEALFPVLRRIAVARQAAGNLGFTTVSALARTGHPDAAAWILEALRSAPADEKGRMMWGLVVLGARRNDAGTRDALRQALMEYDTGGNSSNRGTAAYAFAQLVRMGDVQVFDAIDATAATLGDATVGLPSLPGLDEVRQSSWPGPAGILATWWDDGQLHWLHGYDDATVARLWQGLLAPRADGSYGGAWNAVEALARALQQHPGGIAKPLFLVLCRALGARIAADRLDMNPGPAGYLRALIGSGQRAIRTDAEGIAAIDALRREALGSPVPVLRRIAIEETPLPLDATRRAELFAALGDATLDNARSAWLVLQTAGATVDRTSVEAGLKSTDAEVRRWWLGVAASAATECADVARATLRDPAPAVRLGACELLGATLSLDVVPDLLDALKDPEPNVREAATQAMSAIRFYHDEKAYWDRVFAGKAGLTTASAAEALLEQAKPGNDEATRVLAIRSLGVLGAPETLPFLIDWTKDADATIATAAREAIGAIHARSR